MAARKIVNRFKECRVALGFERNSESASPLRARTLTPGGFAAIMTVVRITAMPHQTTTVASRVPSPPPQPCDQRRRRPRQQRSNYTVSLILQAADELFSTKGFKNTTSEDIVRRAGFGVASLYDYFPNKIAIAHALLERKSVEISEEAQRIFDKASTEPLHVSLPRLARALFERFRENKWTFVDLVTDVPELREAADLYSIDKLIYQSSLDYLKSYEPELGASKVASSHEFLNFLFASTVRAYLSSPNHRMDDETFITHLSAAVLAYATNGIASCDRD